MKTFRQFIFEARETQASQLAKQRGWRGNGHGDWYDATGKLVAKTVGGELKISSGRQSKGQEEPQASQQQTQEPVDQNQQPEQDNQEGGKGIVVVFGRFNPPGKSHSRC